MPSYAKYPHLTSRVEVQGLQSIAIAPHDSSQINFLIYNRAYMNNIS